uniref:uncharacterized protein LOC120325816 n=1 Tax=Styela clava TaxID=7725 RepID=UPI001939C024|nr:uncharacterized protein LOC120325816 [Styela clava]
MVHSTSCHQSKFRVVFDSSAECKGTSLNKNLFSGPDNNNMLTGVLIRFRQELTAFVCDIKEMFHRIKVSPDDTDAQRFLWWKDHNLDSVPIDFKMLSHNFGNTSSPFVATFALHKVATDNLSNADEMTVRTVMRNFYVDDGLKSVDDPSDAVRLIKQLTELLATGGFHLTKFMSNDINVLQSVPESDRAPAIKDLNLESNSLSQTLCVQWNMHTDEFVIYVNIEPKALTRRGILSMVSQIFDPLGFVQPFILPAKRILQDLCIEGYSWDDPITGLLKDRWEKWIDKLHALNGLAIPRCYKPQEFKSNNIQLHCLCDASTSGYGASAYLRLTGDKGEVYCSFVRGVARVTPKQSLTIQRLELIAAVVAAELANSILQELDHTVDSDIYWSDSMSVIQMINNRSERFKTFVANRINTIHLLSKPHQWHHVEHKLNPADIASRGLMPDKLNKAGIWFKGPQFIWGSEDAWTVVNDGIHKVPCDPQLASEMKVHYTEPMKDLTDSSPLHELLLRYSSFEKLRKAVAWLLRFRTYATWKFSHSDNSPTLGFLSVEELDCATKEIMKLVQRSSLSEELKYFEDNTDAEEVPLNLQNKKKLKTQFSKTLLKCNPFVQDGILRVGGRLRNSGLPVDQKHPIILPPYHHVTKLIITKHHEMTGHSGTLHTLSSVRGKYWILKGQSAVAKVVRDCVACNRRSAKVGEQRMADLPFSRVTAAFLQAFFRFTSRRGKPAHVYSDNGSNLVAGSKAIADGINKWNSKQIDTSLSQKGIQWHFSPPLSSHQNGVVERMVREVKRILRALLDGQFFNRLDYMSIKTSPANRFG